MVNGAKHIENHYFFMISENYPGASKTLQTSLVVPECSLNVPGSILGSSIFHDSSMIFTKTGNVPGVPVVAREWR